jgi:hypothetical protein
VLVWTAAAKGWTNTSGSFALSISGDNIVLMSGSLAAPSRFHYALTYNVAFDAPSSTLTSNQCALPATLAAKQTALALSKLKGGLYNGPTGGSREELLAAISDPDRWTQSDTVVYDLTALPAFAVRVGTTPAPTTLPATTAAPTAAPITSAPTTGAPSAATTTVPTTNGAPSAAPTTGAPSTSAPTTGAPSAATTTAAPGSSGSGAVVGGVIGGLIATVALIWVGIKKFAPEQDASNNQVSNARKVDTESSNPAYAY